MSSTASIRLRALPCERYGHARQSTDEAGDQNYLNNHDNDHPNEHLYNIDRDAEATVITRLVYRGEDGLDPDTIILSEQIPKWKRRCSSSWWLEVLAALAVMAAEVATCSTLWPYDEQPLPQWGYFLSIGALLATYSVVLRLGATYLLSEGLARLKWRWYHEATQSSQGLRSLYDFVLHDDATRGPFGALRFLCKLPSPFRWQWIGCVLLLVSLLVGPFEQQMLEYKLCAVEDTTADKTNTLARTPLFLGKRTLRSRRNGMTLSVAEQTSINAGISGAGATTYACKTGHCAYGYFTSVGYCSRCTDVSDQIHSTFLNTSTLPLQTMRKNWQQNSTICLPSGLCNRYMYNIKLENEEEAAAGAFATCGLASTNYDGVDHVGHQMFQIIIGLAGGPFNPATGKVPAQCRNDTTRSWQCQGYAAAECALFPCIRNYSASVAGGKFQEDVVGTEINALNELEASERGSFRSAIYRLGLNESALAYLRTQNYTWNDTSSAWLAYNVNSTTGSRDLMTTLSAFDRDLLNTGNLYIMDGDFHRAVTMYMGEAFSGNLTGYRDGHDRITISHGDGLLGIIYNYGNFSLERTQSLFNNISMSLTRHIRQDPGVSLVNDTVYGTAYMTRTCLHVRWLWWSGPAALAILSLSFFTAVAWKSRKMTKEVRSWKSSPLPLLFNQPPDIGLVGTAFPDMQHIHALELIAKNTLVKLVRDEDGLMELRSKKDLTASASVAEV